MSKILHIHSVHTIITEEEDMDCLVQTIDLDSNLTEADVAAKLSTGGPIRVKYENEYYAILETKVGFLPPDFSQSNPTGYGEDGIWLIGRDEVDSGQYINEDGNGNSCSWGRIDRNVFGLTYLTGGAVQVYHNKAPIRFNVIANGMAGALNISKVINGMLPPETRIVPQAGDNPSLQPQLAFITNTTANATVDADTFGNYGYPTGATCKTYFQSFNGVCYSPTPWEIVTNYGTRWAKIQA